MLEFATLPDHRACDSLLTAAMCDAVSDRRNLDSVLTDKHGASLLTVALATLV